MGLMFDGVLLTVNGTSYEALGRDVSGSLRGKLRDLLTDGGNIRSIAILLQHS